MRTSQNVLTSQNVITFLVKCRFSCSVCSKYQNVRARAHTFEHLFICSCTANTYICVFNYLFCTPDTLYTLKHCAKCNEILFSIQLCIPNDKQVCLSLTHTHTTNLIMSGYFYMNALIPEPQIKIFQPVNSEITIKHVVGTNLIAPPTNHSASLN